MTQNNNNPLDLTTVEPYVEDESLPKAIIVDLDGTLAHNNGHRTFWEESKVGDDELIEATAYIVRMFEATGHTVIFLSGRSDGCRTESTEWLQRHDFAVDHLYMRKSGDTDQDARVKYDLFNQHIRGVYRVAAVFDDRLQVARLWHAMGLPLFRVGDPDSNF